MLPLVQFNFYFSERLNLGLNNKCKISNVISSLAYLCRTVQKFFYSRFISLIMNPSSFLSESIPTEEPQNLKIIFPRIWVLSARYVTSGRSKTLYCGVLLRPSDIQKIFQFHAEQFRKGSNLRLCDARKFFKRLTKTHLPL
jgi:hypothetical protein